MLDGVSVAGGRYEVISEETPFKMGDIVIAIESDDVPFCVAEEEYHPDRTVKAYKVKSALILGVDIIEAK